MNVYVINVLTNVNHIQSTLQSHLPHDEPTIDVDFK